MIGEVADPRFPMKLVFHTWSILPILLSCQKLNSPCHASFTSSRRSTAAPKSSCCSSPVAWRDKFRRPRCALHPRRTTAGRVPRRRRSCHRPGKRLKVDPVAFARLYSPHRRLRPDLIHTWLFDAGSYGRFAAEAAGVKHIVAGEYFVDRWKTTWQWIVDRRLACATNRYVTNSPAVRDQCDEARTARRAIRR